MIDSPMIGQCFDTMILASTNEERLLETIKIYPMFWKVLETVLSHLEDFFSIPQIKAHLPPND